jgi:AraC family transcriptional regulator of adaptative response / methylphosphotriester-DNA alkyltransferase methyltransferase
LQHSAQGLAVSLATAEPVAIAARPSHAVWEFERAMFLGTIGIAHPRAPLRRMPNVSIQRPATVRLRTSLFEDAVRIVETEYGSDLSLDDIAHRVASSRRQLQRAYAEIGHTTFRDHLTRVRMDRAADLLAAERLTVREVANRVGYRQPAQFAKAFRRQLGVAPSEYRLNGRHSTVGSLAPRAEAPHAAAA